MNKFKIILDLATLILISILLFVFSFEEAEEIIPESSNVLTIEKWDKSSHKNDILDVLRNEAKSQDIQIVKRVKDITKAKKETYIFNKNKADTLSVKENNITPLNKLIEKEIKGQYYIVGDDFDRTHILESLKKVGVTAQIEELNRVVLFIDLILENNLFIPIISIISLYMLYFLYERTFNFKRYAIQMLHGFSNLQIMYNGSKKRMLYWVSLIFAFIFTNWLFLMFTGWLDNPNLFLFRLLLLIACFTFSLLILWILSYLLLFIIDITLMIKGKKTYKMLIIMGMFTKYLMILILSILIVQNIETYKKVSSIYESQKFWGKLDGYYSLDFSPKLRDEEEQKELERKTYNLVKHEEKKGGILLKNNNMNMPQRNNYIPENGNVFFANGNFIKLYSSINKDFKKIVDNDSEVDVYLPPRFKKEKQEIQKDYQVWLTLQNAKNDNRINTIILPHNIDVFSFDRITELKFESLDSPIIMILNPDDLSGSFYTAAISQGGYVFKDFDEITKSIKTYGLENDISGVTNYKDSVLSELNKMKVQMLIVLATMISNIIVLVISTLFETMQYFEWNKKVLLLKKMHGFSSIRSNATYLVFTMSLAILMTLATYIILQSFLLVFIFTSLILIQLIIQLYYMRYLEKNFKLLMKEL